MTTFEPAETVQAMNQLIGHLAETSLGARPSLCRLSGRWRSAQARVPDRDRRWFSPAFWVCGLDSKPLVTRQSAAVAGSGTDPLAGLQNRLADPMTCFALASRVLDSRGTGLSFSPRDSPPLDVPARRDEGVKLGRRDLFSVAAACNRASAQEVEPTGSLSMTAIRTVFRKD